MECIERVEDNIEHNIEMKRTVIDRKHPVPREPFMFLIMQFPNQSEAEKWNSGAPDIKQQDWLDGGVEILGFPASKPVGKVIYS